MSDEPNGDYREQRMKHLEMIQGAIARYSDFSARVKNLAIAIVWTVFLGFLGFLIGEMAVFSAMHAPFDAKKIASVWVLFYILVVTLLYISSFCFLLDMHYCLRGAEFLKFYDRVRAQPSDQRPDFCMTVPPDITKMFRMFGIAMFKPIMPTLRFYIALLICSDGLVFVLIYLIFLWHKV